MQFAEIDPAALSPDDVKAEDHDLAEGRDVDAGVSKRGNSKRATTRLAGGKRIKRHEVRTPLHYKEVEGGGFQQYKLPEGISEYTNDGISSTTTSSRWAQLSKYDQSH